MDLDREVQVNPTQADLRRLGWRISGNTAIKITDGNASLCPERTTRTVKAFLAMPIRSEANVGGKLRAKLNRKAEQKAAVTSALQFVTAGRGKPKSVQFVLLTAQPLDDDNLARAFKVARDSISMLCGIDDRERVWKYRQEKLRPWEKRGAWVVLKW